MKRGTGRPQLRRSGLGVEMISTTLTLPASIYDALKKEAQAADHGNKSIIATDIFAQYYEIALPAEGGEPEKQKTPA